MGRPHSNVREDHSSKSVESKARCTAKAIPNQASEERGRRGDWMASIPLHGMKNVPTPPYRETCNLSRTCKGGDKTAKIITHFIKQVKRYSAMLGAVPFSPDQAEKYVTPQITQSDFGCAGSDRHGLSSYKIQCRAWNGEGGEFCRQHISL